MKLIAIYGSGTPISDAGQLLGLLNMLAGLEGCEMVIEEHYYEHLKQSGSVELPAAPTFREAPATDADLALSIGGDGTFLSTVHKLAHTLTPVMGINSGHLGYLSAAEMSQAKEIAECISAGSYITEERSMLQVRVTDSAGKETHKRYGLNEVAVLRRDTASMISVNATLDGHRLACYHADGLIVSTPTGSTAYNLSAGGPIAAPHTGIWVITPVAPHSLNMRPLVVADTSDITLELGSRSDTVLLSIDGNAIPIAASSAIHIVKAPLKVRVALLSGHNFIDTLRRKLLWGYETK